MAAYQTSMPQGPPYSVHSEKVVLGSMLSSPDLIKPISGVIENKTVFYSGANERLYEALLAVQDDTKTDDTRELVNRLVELKEPRLDMSEGALKTLAREGAQKTEALAHAEIVAEKARMRLLIETISDILNDAYRSTDGFDAVLDRSMRRLEAIASE